MGNDGQRGGERNGGMDGGMEGYKHIPVVDK